MSIGAYSFTPASVTLPSPDYDQVPFGMFGGTSISAPLVSGTAALVIQELKDNSNSFSPADVNNILISTANDMNNDVFPPASGMVVSLPPLRLLNGEGGVFNLHKRDSSINLPQILDLRGKISIYLNKSVS
jgi:Subtilase family.